MITVMQIGNAIIAFNIIYILLKFAILAWADKPMLSRPFFDMDPRSGSLLLVHLLVVFLAIAIVLAPWQDEIRAACILLTFMLLMGMLLGALLPLSVHPEPVDRFLLRLLDNVMLVFNFMIAVNFQSLAGSN